MRLPLVCLAAGLLASPAVAQSAPTKADREAVAACVAPVRQQAEKPPGPSDAESAATGAAAQLKRAGINVGRTADSCIGVVSTPCLQTPEGHSTHGSADCLRREAAVWDERLNAAYQKRLDGAAPAYRDALRKTQRAWVAFRDAKCAVPYAEHEGGSMAVPMSADCLTTETARQAIWLDNE